jgi:hypothetical protein
MRRNNGTHATPQIPPHRIDTEGIVYTDMSPATVVPDGGALLSGRY